ncbi:hypothetical protein FRB95_000012 [Tulasnella sp. JGI-2019a]|nr:hypothetical protein FRB95_000012 [Tulasnella sp. JGI-2019a]
MSSLLSSSDSSSRDVDVNINSLAFLTPIDPPDYIQDSVEPDSSLDDISPGYCTVSSPPYSLRVSSVETFLDSTPASSSAIDPRAPLRLYVFKTCGPSMHLTFNTRQTDRSASPAFGHSGKIDADLRINGVLKPSDSLRLIIEGTAICRATSSGSAVSKRVLYHTRDLNEANNGMQMSEDQVPTTYPISFELPTTIENSDIPLPPSYYFRCPLAEAVVRYTLRVIWTKRGLLRMNEEINTVFLYLPRSRQASSLPPSWWSPPSATSATDLKSPYAYSPRGGIKEWNTTSLTSLQSTSDCCIQLTLPTLLSYQAGATISVGITVFSPTLAVADLILDSVRVQLIKITTITINLKAETYEETLGVVGPDERDGWMPPCSQVESGMICRTAHGCVSCGRPEGEMVWELAGFIQVQYAIRVSFKPSENQNLKATDRGLYHSQPIELTTDDSEYDDVWARTPASGLVGRV